MSSSMSSNSLMSMRTLSFTTFMRWARSFESVSSVPAQQDSQAVPEPGFVVNDYILVSPPVASGQPSVVEQISPNGTILADDSSDGIPQSTSKVIVISDNEDIEEIKIVDLASKDDEDLEMDIEIVDLTSNSD
ncbi:hypothetical protein AHAS_Ahas11G0120600 [Arachis hypogaea]